MENMLPNMQNDEVSIQLVELEVQSLLKKPKDFYFNTINNKALFKTMSELILKDEMAIERILFSAQSANVPKTEIKELLKRLKLEAKKNTTMTNYIVSSIFIKKVIPGAPVDPKAVLPQEYKFTDSNGICIKGDGEKDDLLISTYPIFITEIKHNKASQLDYVTVSWCIEGDWRSITVERKVIAQKSMIVALSSNELPVTSTNADRIINYLFSYEKTNTNCIPKSFVTNKLGWTEGMEGFLWGRRFLTGHDVQLPSNKISSILFLGRDKGDEQIADGYVSRGDFNTWISLVNDMLVYPDVAFTIYTSLATPLLPIFDVKNFTFELSNPSSSGKTTAMLLGASAWGSPDPHSNSFVNTWNSTPVWIGRSASILNGLPLYLDETKLAKSQDRRYSSGDLVTNTIYMIASGKDKARGTLDGTGRVESFRTILFSTGESPSLELSNDGGSRGRLIDLWGNPFLKTDAESKTVVDRINWTIQNHYDHAGPRLVQYILDHRDQWPLWKSAYREANTSLTQTEAMSPIEMRLGEYFATVATAIPLIHAALPELRRDLPIKDLLASVWGRARKEASAADIGTKAARIVFEWLMNNQEKLYNPILASQGLKWSSNSYIGYCDLDSKDNWTYVGLNRDFLLDLFKKNDFKLKEVSENWTSKGWLQRNGSSDGYQKQISIPGTSVNSKMQKIYFYCISKEAFKTEE